MQHADDEYGVNVDEQGRHSGGPFDLEVSPLMRIEDLRKLIRVGWLAVPSHDGFESGARLSLAGLMWIPSLVPAKTNNCHGLQDKSGIIPALQKLSFAGKNLDDPQRTLAQYAARGAGRSVVYVSHYSKH